MADDIIGIVLRAESDYHFAMSNAVDEAEKYAQECRSKQSAYLEELRRDFHLFERAEHDHFEKTLSESMRQMDEENVILKEQLRNCQIKKAGQISKRLKREVLFLHGDS